MIHAQEGHPWNYPAKYEIDSYKIEFKKLHDFAKEGPLCGKLYINDKLVEFQEDHDGFGGPILITDKYLYAVIWQINIHGFKDILGGFVAEINLQDLSIRTIGRKLSYISIAYKDKDKLYYYDSSDSWSSKSNAKYFDINEDFRPYTFWEALSNIVKEIRAIHS